MYRADTTLMRSLRRTLTGQRRMPRTGRPCWASRRRIRRSRSPGRRLRQFFQRVSPRFAFVKRIVESTKVQEAPHHVGPGHAAGRQWPAHR